MTTQRAEFFFFKKKKDRGLDNFHIFEYINKMPLLFLVWSRKTWFNFLFLSCNMIKSFFSPSNRGDQ